MSGNVSWLFRWWKWIAWKEKCFPWLRLWAGFSGERRNACFNVRAKLLNTSYSWSTGIFSSLSDRLSQLTYYIHFGTLMAKGRLPAETTFLNFLFFGKRYSQRNKADLNSLTNTLKTKSCKLHVFGFGAVLFSDGTWVELCVTEYLWSHILTFLSLVDTSEICCFLSPHKTGLWPLRSPC